MRFCTLLLIAVAAVVSRRCVTHREAGALLTMIADGMPPLVQAGIVLATRLGSAMDALDNEALVSSSSQAVEHLRNHGRSGAAPADAELLTSARQPHICDLCHVGGPWLNKCMECRNWTCTACTFWCTKCPKGRDKYVICRTCNCSGNFSYPAGKVWT